MNDMLPNQIARRGTACTRVKRDDVKSSVNGSSKSRRWWFSKHLSAQTDPATIYRGVTDVDDRRRRRIYTERANNAFDI